MAPAASMELSDMVNSSIVERPATNSTKFHDFFAHCAPATQEFFPELSGNCDSDSDPAAARRPVSPRRHGGHGDFTETTGFSVHLRVLRVSYEDSDSPRSVGAPLRGRPQSGRPPRAAPTVACPADIFMHSGEPQDHENSVVNKCA